MTVSAQSSHGILAILPFLVKGALSLAVLRVMRERNFDIHLAFYLPGGGGYAPDFADDWAADRKLIDLSQAWGSHGVAILDEIVRERSIGLILQIGSPWAYRQLPYVKEQQPELQIVDILYNKVGHTLNHFRYEACFDGVIVESHDMEHYIIRNSSKTNPNVRIVESGIDLKRFTPAPTKTSKDRNLVIGYLGRMAPEKNPIGFVALAESLHTLLPELRFCMFGEGELTEQVKKRIAEGTASSAIRFCGYVAHPSDALAQMDVLIVPSKLDGRPNVIMEANACGIPVIGAPVGGIPELIEPGNNGLVLHPTEHKKIAEALGLWMRDPELLHQLRSSSRLIAETKFDQKRMLNDYESVLCSFIKH